MAIASLGRTLGVTAVVLTATTMAWADAVKTIDQTYEDVYVNEGHSHYYVFIPDEGAVTSIPKDQVESVTIDEDPVSRAALRARWRVSRHRLIVQLSSADASPDAEPERRQNPDRAGAVSQPAVRPQDPARDAPPATPIRPREDAGNAVTEGYIYGVHVKGAPAGEVLRAMLRSHNLDYRVVGNAVYVSSPERLRSEPLEPLVTRVYSPKAMTLGEPLPKVAVTNTAGDQGSAMLSSPQVASADSKLALRH